jgi:hypothetical protein
MYNICVSSAGFLYNIVTMEYEALLNAEWSLPGEILIDAIREFVCIVVAAQGKYDKRH